MLAGCIPSKECWRDLDMPRCAGHIDSKRSTVCGWNDKERLEGRRRKSEDDHVTSYADSRVQSNFDVGIE